jgi:hypothetical protein
MREGDEITRVERATEIWNFSTHNFRSYPFELALLVDHDRQIMERNSVFAELHHTDHSHKLLLFYLIKY